MTTVEMHGAGPSTGSGHQRRRPPKLKSVDRTVSMIVDNYTPLTSAALSARNVGPLVINMDQPPPSSRRSSPNINEEIFKSHSQSSNSMDSSMCIPNNMDNEYPPPVLRKSSSFRRGETIDMMDLPSTSSTSLQHLRKNSSFHSAAGEETVKIVPLSRHYSVRHRPTTVYPTSSFQPLHHPHQQQQDVSSSSRNSATRRNCSMHRSFHDPSQKRVAQNKREPAVKSNSFSSDEQQPPTSSHMMYQQQHVSMPFQQQQSRSSIESELYRSRSNSRSNSQGFDEQLQYLDVWKPSPMPSPSGSHMRKGTNSPRPTSSNSLDQVLSQGSVSPRPLIGTTAKMLRHQHTIAALNPQFLAPIPLLALDKSFDNVYQVKSPVFDMKKSYSLKYKNGPGSSKENRELFKSRKSKSFITDTDPLDVPFGMSPNLSPAGLSASGSIKKHHSPMISPLPQSRGNMLLDDRNRRSGDGADLLPQNPSNFPIEFGQLDFNTIYKSYRAQQKTSTASNRRHKHRRKKSSSSMGQKGDGDFESESITKRKRIVCVVMTVFLGLVVFAVLAVIVTLTHASVAQVQNQTRHVYTFARDSRPIHYPVGGGGGGN